MVTDLVSIAVIAAVAFICPIISQAIPRRPIPETVFLLIGGMICGPHLLDLIHETETIGVLSDLGLSFLFLLAGYEINPKTLTGHLGKRGFVTWFITLAIGFLIIIISPDFSAGTIGGIAVALALTSTAIGTLLPILDERGLLGTKLGDCILSYGTWGELLPVLAMTLLLSTRVRWETLLILGAFATIAVLLGVIDRWAHKRHGYIDRAIVNNTETNSQLLIRAVVMLLVFLVAVSALFDLDVVLGAFAAGFILRYVLPEGSEPLEYKLNSLAFGYFIPLFFIVSGSNIDVTAIAAKPLLLITFIGMLLVVRTLPIVISLSLDKATKTMSFRQRSIVALYCTTALPIIVAVTSVAVDVNAMDIQTASVLVAAGGITVLIMPLFAQLLLRAIDIKPVKAIEEIEKDPDEISEILEEHHEMEREVEEKAKEAYDQNEERYAEEPYDPVDAFEKVHRESQE